MSLALFRLGRLSYRHPLAAIVAWTMILLAAGGTVFAAGGGSITSAITIDGTASQQVLDELRVDFPQMAGGQGSLVFVADHGRRLDQGNTADALANAAEEIGSLHTVVNRPDPTAALQQPGVAASPDGRTPPVDGANLPGGVTPPAGMTPEQMQRMLDNQGGASPAGRADTESTETGEPTEPGDPTQGPHPLTADGQPVPGVLVSADGGVAMMQLQFTEPIESLPDGTIDHVVETARTRTASSGITVLTTQSLKPHTAPLGGSEALGIAFAALVLLLALGSIRAAILPLATAVTGVGIGLGAALGMSNSIQMTSATPVLALMVGLAVGMDYALFIVNRTRRMMIDDDLPAADAVPRAVGTAGSAVTFAGLTVVIALTGLALIGIPFLTTMALVAAATVVMAVLIALTLLPALLRLIGDKLVGPRARARAHAHARTGSAHNGTGLGHRWATGVIKHRGLVTAVITAGLLVTAIPAASMTLGMSDGSTANLHTSERQAYDAVDHAFGPGYNAPLLAVVTATDGVTFTPAQLPVMAADLEAIAGIDTVRPMGIAPDGAVAMLTVIPSQGPTSPATIDLVHTLRDSGAAHIGPDAASVGVAGLAAVNIDISEKLADVLPYYIAIIVALSLIVLALVFRSILVPLKATLGFLLTIGATFGIITAVFQWGWLKDLAGFDTTGPILSFLPIMVTGILYGLAMDYEMFLVSSMREEHVHGAGGSRAITRGYSQAGRVVTAAATIMISVFAGFVLSDDPMVKQFGLALAVGVAIDAFLIRLTLVPALMSYLGDKAWWVPRWLDRALPHLDVEGARLTRHLGQDRETPTASTDDETADAETAHAPLATR